MKNNYSSNDIEQAVKQAEARGLDEFMSKDPRGGKQTTDNIDTRENKVHTDQQVKSPRRSIFDNLMFGSRSPQTNEHMTSSNLITSSMFTGDVLGTDDPRTCNPCEEVREIVKGIREGKYKLRTTGFEEALDDTFQPSRQPSGENLRIPKHWRKHQVAGSSEGFKYHKTYWDGGNMAALRMTNKGS